MISEQSLNRNKDKRPVVCGTEFSPTAVEAVNIAAELARRLDVKLLLLHVGNFGTWPSWTNIGV